MVAVIEELRALGLSMASRYAPVVSEVENEEGELVTLTTQSYISWTTDEAKAHAAEKLGATLHEYRSTDARFSGWEVNVSVVVE